MHPSYVKDTYDFIDKLKDVNDPCDSLLFTMDVEFLCTNIDTRLGLLAVDKIFK